MTRRMIPAIDKQLLAPLGEVAANFSMLDNTLSFQIWLLLFGNSSKEQRTGQIVTAELSFKNKVALFSSLFQYRFPDEEPFERLKAIRKKLRVASEKRNQLLHSVWAASGHKDSSTRTKTTAKEKTGINFEFEKMNVKDINKVADFIAELAYEMGISLGISSFDE